jgi:hypothetical protein
MRLVIEIGFSDIIIKTTRVWFLREQKHTRDGLWPRNPLDGGFPGQRPSIVCFWSLRNHECGFYIYLMPQKLPKNNF